MRAATLRFWISHSGTSNTTRTINVTATYDVFQVTAVWTGGINVSVFAALTSTGPGPTWNSASLPAVQNTPFQSCQLQGLSKVLTENPGN